jgi:hypothetical protein
LHPRARRTIPTATIACGYFGFFDESSRNFRIVDGWAARYLDGMRTLAKQGTEHEADARRRWRTWSWRGSARKGAISVLGFGTLAIGVALTVTPVPSAIVILLGLAVLAREYAWARRLLGPCRDLARRLVTFFRRLVVRPAAAGMGGR